MNLNVFEINIDSFFKYTLFMNSKPPPIFVKIHDLY